MVEGEVLMTRSFVARALQVSECTVDNLAQSGKLPSMMTTAKRRVFRQSDVERLKAQLEQTRRTKRAMQGRNTRTPTGKGRRFAKRKAANVNANATAQYDQPEDFSSTDSLDIVTCEREAHERELGKLDNFAFALLNAAGGDPAMAEFMLDDFIDLLFEDGALSTWRYRIVQRKIREGL